MLISSCPLAQLLKALARSSATAQKVSAALFASGEMADHPSARSREDCPHRIDLRLPVEDFRLASVTSGNNRNAQLRPERTTGKQPLRGGMPVAQADRDDLRDCVGQLKSDGGTIWRGQYEALQGRGCSDTVRGEADLTRERLGPVDGEGCIASGSESSGSIIRDSVRAVRIPVSAQRVVGLSVNRPHEGHRD
jgi:hypothetical protein